MRAEVQKTCGKKERNKATTGKRKKKSSKLRDYQIEVVKPDDFDYNKELVASVFIEHIYAKLKRGEGRGRK